MQPIKLTKATSLPAAMSSLTVGDKKSGGISLAPKKTTSGISLNKEVAKKISMSPLESVEGMQTFLNLDMPQRLIEIGRLFSIAATKPSACIDLALIAKKQGICSYEGSQILDKIFELFDDISTRESALPVLLQLFVKNGKCIEPFVVPIFPTLLQLHGDRSNSIRENAALIVQELTRVICPHAFRMLFPYMTEAMKNEDWRIKVGALDAIRKFTPRMSAQISPLLTEFIPQASDCIIDSKKQVSTAAMDALLAACNTISNDDIRPLVPQLVSVIAKPEETAKTLDCLLETTFVANVDSPTLALIAPLLGKALRGRVTILKRKTARVIDIMCRLVQEPADVAPFVPLLLPALDKCIDEIVDEEVIGVAKAAKEVLLKAMGRGSIVEGAKVKGAGGLEGVNVLDVQAKLFESLGSIIPGDSSSQSLKVNTYISQISSYLVVYSSLPNASPAADAGDAWRSAVAMVPLAAWKECVVPYIAAYRTDNKKFDMNQSLSSPEGELVDDFEDVAANLFRIAALGNVSDAQLDDDIDGANLCNIDFSLAFGGKILLHNTKLRLGKGRRYAIMGKNGAGKTTLLTNVGSGNIEGMPTHLKTLYVQHDDQSDDHGVSIVDEMLVHKNLAGCGITREVIVSTLKGIKFTDEMMAGPRSGLSGGWMMKLILVRAMLSKADILLMDEPTNHLDVASVQWLVDFITNGSDITYMIVSHDTAFLDKVISDVIHYENKKLVYYHGNLTHFVEIHPEAKYYYELESSTLTFKFPTPDRLDGINSTTRSVMKMENITYTYPGASKPQLDNVSVKLCLGSRVAVCGANGAGKSTLIKLLVQETEADEGSGEVWKHHNLRLAYVAQHSFHHIEQHLDDSPVGYMKWRFSAGVDKEDLARPTMKLTEDELDERKGERKYGEIDQIVGRRKLGRTMEYECTFIGQSTVAATYRERERREENKYIALETLVEMGLSKLVQQCDTRIAAAAAGLDIRSLTTAEIQAHLDDFNLDAEYGTHGSIRRLSGGQKVKLVLAAAMWNKPHVIVLDEPTNYLDREALGALTQAIKGFAGGVIIISHNHEFTDALCTEKWLVEGGKCYTTGEVEDTDLKVASSGKLKKSKSAPSLADKSELEGINTNGVFVNKVLLNPRTLESLSKKEVRLLTRCAEVAGVSLEEYVSKITCKSPEWKWL